MPFEHQKHVALALCGIGIYGGGSFVWQLPVLLDGAIGQSLGLTPAEMIRTTTGTFLSWAVGSAVTGVLADRLGRKPVAIVCAILAVLHLFLSAAANGFILLLVARSIGGFAIGGMTLGFALSLEHITEPQQRASRATWLNIYFAGAILLIVAIHVGCSSLLSASSWRTELCYDGIVLGMLVAAAALLVPSSPPMSHTVVRSSAEVEMVHILDENDAGSNAGDNHQLHTASTTGRFSLDMGISLAAISFAFVAVSIIYYSLSYQAGSLSSSINLNVVLLALLDLPGYKLFDHLTARPSLGLRGSLAVLFGLSGCFLTFLSIVARSKTSISSWAPPLLAFLGKMCSAGAFQGVYLLPSELLQPSFQSTAFGVASSCARIATAAVPSLVGTLSLPTSSLLISLVAFAAAGVEWAGSNRLSQKQCRID